MNIKSIKILEKIISAGGNCDWSSPMYCRDCPLRNYKKSANLSKMGCIEALGIEGLSKAEADEKYLNAAVAELADIRIDEILGEDNGSE